MGWPLVTILIKWNQLERESKVYLGHISNTLDIKKFKHPPQFSNSFQYRYIAGAVDLKWDFRAISKMLLPKGGLTLWFYHKIQGKLIRFFTGCSWVDGSNCL